MLSLDNMYVGESYVYRLDATEKTSETAATPAVISDSAIVADAIITFDIDGIASGTVGKGLVVWMEVTIP